MIPTPIIPYNTAFKIEAQFVMPDGRQGVLKFPITDSLQINTEYSYCGTKTVDVSFSTGEFSVEMMEDTPTPTPTAKTEEELLDKAEPLKPLKKEEEMLTGNFIAAIFPDRHGLYQPDAKVYYYEISNRCSLPVAGDLIKVIENRRVNKNFGDDRLTLGPTKKDPYSDNWIQVLKVLRNVKYSCMPAEMEAVAALSSWTQILDYKVQRTTKANIDDFLSPCDAKAETDFTTVGEVLTEKLKEEKSLTINISDLDMKNITVPADEVNSIKVDDSLRISFKNGQEFKVYNMEDKNMNMRKLMGDFMFGKFDNTTVKYSFNGIAFQSADGTYNVYNEDGTLTNVSDMVIDIPVFAIPVAKADLKVGDVILHPADRTPLVVKENAQTAIIAVEPKSNEVKTFAPKKSIFGFDFYTKITTPMDMFGGANADESNPFGNMLPFLMFSDGEFDMNTMLMFTMMNGKGNKGFDTNMMLPLMLMSDKKGGDKIDPFMLMLMTGGNFGNFGKSNATKDTNEG